eukprot:s214_g3.t1
MGAVKLDHLDHAQRRASIMQQLRQFWMEDHLCDVVLKSHDGTEHRAHMAVLSAASVFFKKLLGGSFLEAERVQQKQPVEVAASKAAVSALLDYIYDGQPEMPLEVGLELLRLAQAYDLPKLARSIEAGIVASLDGNVALQVLQEVHGFRSLRAACEEKVAEEFDTCSQQPDFGKLTASQLARIVKREDLGVSREEAVVNAIFAWLKISKDRHAFLGMLLQHVDFQALSIESVLRLGRTTLSGLTGDDLHIEVEDALTTRKRTRSPGAVQLKRRRLQHWSPFLGASTASIEASGREVLSLPCSTLHWHKGEILAASDRTILCWKPDEPAARVRRVAGEGAAMTGINDLGPICRVSISPTSGEMFVSDYRNERLIRFENGSGHLVLADIRANAMLYSPNGVLYVVSQGGRTVQKMVGSTLQTVLASESLPADLQFSARRMFVTKEGVMYVSDDSKRNSRILRINPTDSLQPVVVVGEIPTEGRPHIEDLFVTEGGTIYVADAGQRKVWAFHPGGSAFTEVLRIPDPFFPVAPLLRDRSLYVSMMTRMVEGEPRTGRVYEYLLPSDLQLHELFGEMERFTVPEVHRAALEGSLLQVMALGIPIHRFRLPDAPRRDAVAAALQRLLLMRAVLALDRGPVSSHWRFGLLRAAPRCGAGGTCAVYVARWQTSLSAILTIVMKIQEDLGDATSPRQDWEDLSEGDVYRMFAVVRGCASAVATTQGLWLVACGRIRCAIEHAEKLLLYPCGVVYMKAGDFPRARQQLEESLAMMRSVHGNMDHLAMAVTLRALGQVSLLAGDLEHAKQKLEESLEMKRALNKENVDKDDPDIAAVLGELGQASLLAKDPAQAKQYLKESLKLKCALYGVGPCPETAATLQILGQASLQSGDLDEAKQHLEECLQMLRSLYGNDDRTDIAATLHALGVVARKLGDLEHAKQQLEECLRMTRCLCGDEDSCGVALTLRELGEVSQQAGDPTIAEEYLGESLRILSSLAGPDSAPGLPQVVSDVGRSCGSTASSSEDEDGDLFIKQSKDPEVSFRRLPSLHTERNLPETAVALRSLGVVGRKAGDLEQARQHLEESLQTFRSLYGERDHSDIAATLRELGEVERQAGDLNSAKQHLEVSLRMYRALYGDSGHPESALALRSLGVVSRKVGDFDSAMQHLHVSFHMFRSCYGHGDHSDIAATLREIGELSRQAGDFESSKRHLEESLRMYRQLYGDTSDPEFAETLRALGLVTLRVGDAHRGKEHLEESLQMKRSLHGDRHRPEIAATLHELGLLSRSLGYMKDAKQHLEESLQMIRSLHGDRDHADIAATLYALGIVSGQVADFDQATLHLEECLRMKQSMHWEADHPDIAKTLRALGVLSGLAGDFEQSTLHLQACLQMKLSLHGGRHHPGIAATLHDLGQVNRQIGDFQQAQHFLKESLQMNRCLRRDARDDPNIAATCHALGMAKQRRDLQLDESRRMIETLHADMNHPDL